LSSSREFRLRAARHRRLRGRLRLRAGRTRRFPCRPFTDQDVMTDFAAKWSDLKKAALKGGALPPGLVLAMSQGRDLGPALKSFDKAVKPDERSKAIVGVLKAKTGYEEDLRDALKEASTSQEKANVQQMAKDLASLWVAVEQAAQPPRPSGSMISHEVLRSFNLAEGVKPRYLDVKATQVSVYVEIDAVLDKLIKEGKESLKLSHLGDIAKAELDKARPAFVKTIEAIEAKIKSGEATAEGKAKEANEVLKHYARIVEDRVNKAVADEWAKYLARAQHLSDFKLKSGLKITLGVIGVGVAAASLALSFGTAWMSIFAIAKGVAELVQNIGTLSQGIEKTAKSLKDNLVKTDQLNKQREEARAKNGGQKASKSKEAAKELLNALMPVTKLMTKSSSTVEADAKQLLGQVSKLETAADNAVGGMNKAVKLLSSLPDKAMNDAQRAEARKMATVIQEFFEKITALHKEAQAYGDLGDKALASVKKLLSADSWSAGLTSSAAGIGTKATAAYAAANFIFQCASAGKALIPL
jgi:hypothetical protein